jgi:hypothetical protein
VLEIATTIAQWFLEEGICAPITVIGRLQRSSR